MKSKRTYKIIACVSIWLSVIIAAFGLSLAKPKAGVIIDYTFVLDENTFNIATTQGGSTTRKAIQLSQVKYVGFSYSAFNNMQLDIYENQSNNNYIIGSAKYSILFGNGYSGSDVGPRTPATFYGSPVISQTYFSFELFKIGSDTYYFIDLTRLLNISQISSLNDPTIIITLQFNSQMNFYRKINTISDINNIYDLEQNDVALIYLSDISGLNAAAYRDEITINWGYIDNNDNTLFTVHAPTIQAQRTDNNVISLAMPVNAAGDATSYYSIDQSAILTTISAGGATATAHIYGIYVWIQQSRIQWGLAEFDTSGLPASGASMNYITSLTSLYDYTATNTSTMTCRLSISNNFNFITIKNQPILSAQNINIVIQQGGFLPAWAVYNWARGSAAGYTSGEQAGAAPYQPGGAGYQEIFEAGRQAGIAEDIGTVNWFVESFRAVDAMLNIRIFPNITIGYLVGIPFVITVVWFIIRMFRGGGSSS